MKNHANKSGVVFLQAPHNNFRTEDYGRWQNGRWQNGRWQMPECQTWQNGRMADGRHGREKHLSEDRGISSSNPPSMRQESQKVRKEKRKKRMAPGCSGYNVMLASDITDNSVSENKVMWAQKIKIEQVTTNTNRPSTHTHQHHYHT